MAMNKQQAISILQKIDDLYDMGFNQNKQKAITWVETLMRNGDYEQTIIKLNNFMKASKFKPTIADVLASKPKAFEIDEKPVEETHQYKLEHDPAYRQEWEETRRKARAFIKELRSND
ncbi:MULTISPECIES: hypothetical protein [unclassified Staphylococcus]|uniref:hypothetical protein n=1 Tax=unclassified Staphylococcus TaxID=91994 RepID=UPI0021CE95CE|nr:MULTISPECIES: hypothetical protein [unclassified Staphylococcus]UXR72337.1 hypothetical protein MUA88_03935 [Staphylococcus sp. IVB6240]UXR75624.1 hypothetical protein MUA74_08110 [Staphylococcus sp. IVB6233]UXR79824.1 hypothetical protein MUA65_07715 [Staphylococcus sp. IVB6218]